MFFDLISSFSHFFVFVDKSFKKEDSKLNRLPFNSHIGPFWPKFMKNMLKKAIYLLVPTLLLVASSAFAAITPTLSLYATGNGQVQVNVNGDPNATVTFYYQNNGSGSYTSSNIGSTNSSGFFTTTFSSGSYNIGYNSQVYVVVNGVQSSYTNWPYSNGGGNGSVSLSQNSLALQNGQNASVNIYGGSNGYYVSSNSNAGIASVSINGNQVNVYANGNQGSTNILICSNNNYGNNNCATLYVTVNGGNNNYNYGSLNLSQSYLNLGIYQTMNVSVYGGSGVFYVSSNSNPNVATVSINGSNVSVTGYQNGSTQIQLCSSASNSYNQNYYNNYVYQSCATLSVNVGGYNYNNYYSNPPITYYPTNYYTQPTLASGVFLSNIPYTGATMNMSVVLFIVGMMLWSAFMTFYYLKKRGVTFAGAHSYTETQSERVARFKKENFTRKNK